MKQRAESGNMLFGACALLVCTSCATILAPREDRIAVFTGKAAKVVYQGDTLLAKKDRVKLLVKRDNEPFLFRVITDSTITSYTIPAKNSFEYYANIFENFGLGMLIDKNQPKRYTHPTRIFLSNDGSGNYSISKRVRAPGEWYAHLALPYINAFQLQPEGQGQRTGFGFLGLGGGVDYYPSRTRFFRFDVSAVTNFIAPVPAPVRYDEFEAMSSIYATWSHHHETKHFILGYGVSFSRNRWSFSMRDSTGGSSFVERNNFSAGLIVPVTYRFRDRMNFELRYQPMFFRPASEKKFVYEYVISGGVSWQFRLR